MHDDLWTPAMRDASDALSIIIKLEADRCSTAAGFDYRPSQTAPSTFEEAVAEYRMAQLSGLDYRVSNSHSDRTIFRTPETNHALRFWHDMIHVELGADFTLDGERRVAREHLRILRRSYGIGTESTIGRLMRIDSLGQNECRAAIGTFPEDQRQFAANALRHGIGRAIALERLYLQLRSQRDTASSVDSRAAG